MIHSVDGKGYSRHFVSYFPMEYLIKNGQIILIRFLLIPHVTHVVTYQRRSILGSLPRLARGGVHERFKRPFERVFGQPRRAVWAEGNPARVLPVDVSSASSMKTISQAHSGHVSTSLHTRVVDPSRRPVDVAPSRTSANFRVDIVEQRSGRTSEGTDIKGNVVTSGDEGRGR